MAASTAEQMVVHPWEWIILSVIVVALILFDLLGHVRKAHEPTLKEAGIWSLIYIGFSIIFGGILYLDRKSVV